MATIKHHDGLDSMSQQEVDLFHHVNNIPIKTNRYAAVKAFWGDVDWSTSEVMKVRVEKMEDCRRAHRVYEWDRKKVVQNRR